MASEPGEHRRRQQRNRNIAVALTLVALAVLFFLTTILRLGGNVAERPL